MVRPRQGNHVPRRAAAWAWPCGCHSRYVPAKRGEPAGQVRWVKVCAQHAYDLGKVMPLMKHPSAVPGCTPATDVAGAEA